MKLVKQVLSDLIKELGWVIFYGFLTTAAVMALILISLSYQNVSSQNKAITRFIDNNITITRLQDTRYNANYNASQSSFSNAESLQVYFGDAFSASGNAGTYIIMPGRLGYQQVIILLGTYSDLTPYGITDVQEITFAVSYDQRNYAKETLSIGNREYPLDVAPKDMEVYHPYFHISAESGYLSNTLFVFSKDYASVMEIFPETEYWELQASALLERIILTDPNENDIIRLRSVVAKSTGRYLHIQTIEDYLSSATVSGVRTHQIYLIFYSVATTILLAAMFLNLYRIMKRKIPDYSIHNLFGASDVFIYCRMFYFAVLYNAIPIIWTVCIMSLNKMATPLNLMVLISIIILTVLIIVEIIHKQFKIHFLQGLRRE